MSAFLRPMMIWESKFNSINKRIFLTLTRWLVHYRILGETITIELNPRATEEDVFMDVKATSGIHSLFSFESCSHHMECPSVLCLPIDRIIEGRRTALFIKRLLGIDTFKGICFPL